MTSCASAAAVQACFRPTYASARAAFLRAADEAGARVDVHVNDRASGPRGGTLTTDVAVLGPESSESALLVFSGTHGPEGFSGSAAQVALLGALARRGSRAGVRIVLVHAINPWGFAHLSRTTENGVDLNRNFIDWGQPAPENPLYDELHATLMIDRWDAAALEAADQRLDAWIEKHGRDVFVDVTARGQYTHPDGMNYGGSAREWSNETVEAVIGTHLRRARRIALIDWHTGLGEPGQPFFLCFNEREGAAWQRACRWWGTDRVEDAGGFEGAGRPNYQGLLFYGVQRYASQAEVTGAVVEFGTLGNRETRHALQGDQWSKRRTDGASEQESVSDALLEAFAPASVRWRRSVLGHAIEIQEQALAGLAQWGA